MDQSNFNIPLPDVGGLLKDSSLVRNYANGFIIGRTQTDMFLVPTYNSQPVMLTSMSFPTAKRLLGALQNQIKQIEDMIGEIKDLPASHK